MKQIRGAIVCIGQAECAWLLIFATFVSCMIDTKTLDLNNIKNWSCLSSKSRFTSAFCFPMTPTTRSRMRLKVPWSHACMRQLGFLQGLKPGRSSNGFHSGWTDQSLLTFFGILRTPLLFCCVNNWQMCRVCESKTTTRVFRTSFQWLSDLWAPIWVMSALFEKHKSHRLQGLLAFPDA